MDTLTVIALISIVALLGLVAIMLFYGRQREERLQRQSLMLERQRITLPVRLQAYERFALLMERITPEALVLSIPSAGLSATQYEARLLEQVRTEWAHNLAQQVYVSRELWTLLCQARGSVSQFIALCGKETAKDASAEELVKNILTAILQLREHPVQSVLAAIRAEAASIF